MGRSLVFVQECIGKGKDWEGCKQRERMDKIGFWKKQASVTTSFRLFSSPKARCRASVYAKVCRTHNLTGIGMFMVYQS
jgi:hypothetical protein